MSGYYIHILSYWLGLLVNITWPGTNMTIESVILTWCKETENILSDSQVSNHFVASGLLKVANCVSKLPATPTPRQNGVETAEVSSLIEDSALAQSPASFWLNPHTRTPWLMWAPTWCTRPSAGKASRAAPWRMFLRYLTPSLRRPCIHAIFFLTACRTACKHAFCFLRVFPEAVSTRHSWLWQMLDDVYTRRCFA